MADKSTSHSAVAAYYALGTSRDSYRYNHLYPAYIAPKYYGRGIIKHDNQHRDLHFLKYTFLSCLRYTYFVIMWLLRKLLKVRVCQHAIASCLIILAFVLLSYVYQEDENKNDIKVHVQTDGINRRLITKTLPALPVYETEAKCDNKDPCLRGHHAYHVRTGNKNQDKPYICLDGKEMMNPADMWRGLNIVLIKDATHMQQITAQNFDIYEDGSSKLEAFLNNIQDGQVIVLVSFDDTHHRLSIKAKNIFKEKFHSKHIDSLNYRGQWAFIGQRGAPIDGLHEKVNLFEPKPGVEWGEQLTIQGCFAVKGKEEPKPKKRTGSPPCGVTTECDSDSIPMHIESGEYNSGRKTLPHVCIDGKMVLGDHRIGKEDPASRGLNFVIYNPIDKEVVSIARFDTYESATQDLQATTYLQSVQDGHLVIGTVFDEASRQLSYETKGVLKNLGSTQIFGLDYRGNWAFVGQKGIEGSSPYEKIGEKQPSSWGAKAELKECIPKQIVGVDGKLAANKKRQRFCDDYIGYPELCSEENIDKPLFPVPLDDSSLRTNPAYSTPIVVIPGTDLYALERCLASLIEVPGLRTSNVVVIMEGSFSEPNDLVSLYGFRGEYVKGSANYQQTLLNGLERSLTAFQGKEYLIVLEENVAVTPDFLHYFSQTLHLLDKDNTIMTVSAWNQNGFEDTSGDPHLIYRTEDFPGFGWVLRRKMYNDEMHNKNSGCCGRPTWRGWYLNEDLRKGRHSIVPDLSRIKMIKKDGFYEEKSFMDAYLAKRKASSGYLTEPKDVYKVIGNEYDKELQRLVDRSISVKELEVTPCLEGGDLQLQHEKDTGSLYSISYHQNALDDQVILRKLAQCFGLFVYEDSTIRGLHKGLLRFTRHGNQYMLVGSQTSYYKEAAAKGKVLSVIGNQSHDLLRR